MKRKNILRSISEEVKEVMEVWKRVDPMMHSNLKWKEVGDEDMLLFGTDKRFYLSTISDFFPIFKASF